jgi:hypothetical protein
MIGSSGMRYFPVADVGGLLAVAPPARAESITCVTDFGFNGRPLLHSRDH